MPVSRSSADTTSALTAHRPLEHVEDQRRVLEGEDPLEVALELLEERRVPDRRRA